MRIDNEPAFILHTRPYRDSSLLVEFITPGFGRVSAVVKGVRGTGKAVKLRRSLMQPFVPLVIGWSGNTDLKATTHFEADATPVHLPGERLFSALYVNELLIRLLQHYDENPRWFQLYKQVLFDLRDHDPLDAVLRRFEFQLLEALGYGVDLTVAEQGSERIDADKAYIFDAGRGFLLCPDPGARGAAGLYRGADLLAIAAGNYNDSARRSAKRLCRHLLAVHLGDKPLKSRDLFR